MSAGKSVRVMAENNLRQDSPALAEKKPGPHGLFFRALAAEKRLAEEKRGERKSPTQAVNPGNQEPIVEADGIFSISGKIETSAVKLDPDFKALVDSVLN